MMIEHTVQQTAGSTIQVFLSHNMLASLQHGQNGSRGSQATGERKS
jgi:hypothetical protein